MFASWNPAQPEITDLIVQHDPYTLERLPVRKRDVLEVFTKFGNRTAIKAVEALPERNGLLDATEIDRLLITTHWEMQVEPDGSGEAAEGDRGGGLKSDRESGGRPPHCKRTRRLCGHGAQPFGAQGKQWRAPTDDTSRNYS